MFKAISTTDGSEIIIIDPEWDSKIGHLRSLDVRDELICQGCRQPVRTKAGAVKTRHFSHKSLGNCNYGNETAALLQARVVLYERLRQEFGSDVTCEKIFDPEYDLPRPVDCWVQRGECRIAYWIVENQIRPNVRDRIITNLDKLSDNQHFIFHSQMLREDIQDCVLLTTTERVLLRRNWVDVELHFGRMSSGLSLHYLDPQSKEIISFRSISSVHEPNVYVGRKLQHPLDEIIVSKKTGELAHPKERERYYKLTDEVKAATAFRSVVPEAKRNTPQAVHISPYISPFVDLNAEATKSPMRETQWEPVSPYRAPATYRRPQRKADDTIAEMPKESEELTCVICGELTRDWWIKIGGTNKCRCRKCYKRT